MRKAEYISRTKAMNAVCDGCYIEFPNEDCKPCTCEIRKALLAVPSVNGCDDDRSLSEIMDDMKRDTMEFIRDMEKELAILKITSEISCDNCGKQEECQYTRQYKGELPFDCPMY